MTSTTAAAQTPEEPKRDSSTESIHGHDYYDIETGSFKVPLYLSAIFEHPDRRTGKARLSDRGFELKYSREENPTVRAFERVLAKLEGAKDSLAFSSGMAAISAFFLSNLGNGDTILLNKDCYGATQEFALDLHRYGVKTVLGGPDTDDILSKIKPGLSFVFVETISNPNLRVLELRKVARRCAEVGTRLVVDNTFATPLLYNPLAEGAWASIHSVTKYLAGHNDVVAGGIALNESEDITKLWNSRRRLGSIMGPFEAYLALRGVSTLKARFEAQCRSAQVLAEHLAEDQRIDSVLYPGLKTSEYHSTAAELFKEGLYGGVISFRVKGGKSQALKVLRNVRVIQPSPSLGGTESLMSYPLESASRNISPQVREELGITDNLLRLSIGLEDVEDLKTDISQALAD